MFMVLILMSNNTYTHINDEQHWQWGDQLTNISTIFLDCNDKIKYYEKDITVSAGL